MINIYLNSVLRRRSGAIQPAGSRKWMIPAIFSVAWGFVSLEKGQCALQFQTVAVGLSVPVALTHAGDASGRLFVTLQDGRILVHEGGQILPVPFLDIRPLVSCCNERGLSSTAFHPDHASNGFFFVNYTNLSGNTVIARYRVSGDPNRADPLSGQPILVIPQPFANHNGGQLQFGPDGKLYIGVGDGGAAGDPGNRAQHLRTLLGKILRIDVDRFPRYSIPVDNPFSRSNRVRREIWA